MINKNCTIYIVTSLAPYRARLALPGCANNFLRNFFIVPKSQKNSLGLNNKAMESESSFVTNLQGPRANKFLWILFERPKGQKIPLELINIVPPELDNKA